MNQKSLFFLIIALTTPLFLIFLLAPTAKQTSGFENLDEVILFAQKQNELATPDNMDDPERPSWRKFLTKRQPSWLRRKTNNLLEFLTLRKPIWSPGYFRYMLKKQANGKIDKKQISEYVVRLCPNKNSRFIIFGDLEGAFHSLIRDLQKLKSLNIIDNSLKLINSNDHLVFMGDAAASSPFIMELLTLIMKLDERNPEKVFYLAGNIERRGSWDNYGLGEELMIKGKHLPTSPFSMPDLVEQYFHTLPLGIYLSIPPHNTNNFVRISHFSMIIPGKDTYKEFVDLLDDSRYEKQLTENRQDKKAKIIRLSTKQEKGSPFAVDVKVIIKSVFKAKEHKKHDGLHILMQDKNAMAWTPLSGPTAFNKKFNDFYNDAFTILQLAPQLNDWTIKLYYRDVRTKEDFKTNNFNFLTGAQLPTNE